MGFSYLSYQNFQLPGHPVERDFRLASCMPRGARGESQGYLAVMDQPGLTESSLLPCRMVMRYCFCASLLICVAVGVTVRLDSGLMDRCVTS